MRLEKENKQLQRDLEKLTSKKPLR